MKYRVTVQNKVAGKGFGETTKFQDVATVWASVTFTKGMKAMHEGALDAYDTVMIRMRYNDFTTRDSLLIYDGITRKKMTVHLYKRCERALRNKWILIAFFVVETGIWIHNIVLDI